MASRISTVLIDSDLESRKNIERTLNGEETIDVTGVATDIHSGYDMVARGRPMLVIIDLDSYGEQAFALIERMQSEFVDICIFASSADSSAQNILRAMRAGATDFLPRPVDAQNLHYSLNKVGRLIKQRPEPLTGSGRIITCFSPKGGMGTTTVATNLAVSLQKLYKKPTLLVDMDLESGDISMFLNIKTQYTILDVAANFSKLDRAFLQGVLAKHSSDVYLLAEPQKIEDAENISPGQVTSLLDMLRGIFSYVVVDAGSRFDERNVAVFDSSDMILLVGVLSLPPLRNMQKALDLFDRLGYGKSKVKLVVNRYMKKGDISVEDAEKTLSYKVFRHLPNDYAGVMKSINRGIPLPLLEPNSEIGRSFAELAREVEDGLGDSGVKLAAGARSTG